MRAALVIALAGALAVVAAGGAQPDAAQLPTIKVPAELRVVLGSAPHEAGVGGGMPWRLVDAWQRTHARGSSATWRIERNARRLRGVSADGRTATAWSEEPFAVVADGADAVVSWEGRPYRGELRYVATDTAILVVNVLLLEEYLRGVVPLEIGRRQPNEAAAVEAQAIAARSYTVVRTLEGVTRAFDLTAQPADQVYGGVSAESALSDAAVRATNAQVLTYGGQVVRAPYHSACGGTTAAPAEVWNGAGERWLQSVDDHAPGSGRAWCEAAPRFSWERTLDERAILDGIARHTGKRVARVGMARVLSRTPSGRVGVLTLDTDAGTITMRGNEIRFAFRGLGGEILNSTYFSLEPIVGQGGRLSQLSLRGQGHGHGVGMCQWGAIGRSRAGMSASEILQAYYPGTRLARVDHGRR